MLKVAEILFRKASCSYTEWFARYNSPWARQLYLARSGKSVLKNKI